MLSRGDAVVYKCRGLYKVEEIGTLDFSFVDNKKQYYTLRSVEDAADKAYIPTEDESNIRRPVSREEAQCIADFCPENWVRVLKTTYNRTKTRGSITSLDRKYQMMLEHALYSEFAFALGIPASEMQQFIEDHAEHSGDRG